MLADHASRSSRWAANKSTDNVDLPRPNYGHCQREADRDGARLETPLSTKRAKADAATDPRPRAIAEDGRTGPPGRADAASSPPIYPIVALCRAEGIPEPIPEYKFHPLRKWRADYCWPIHRIIVEIEGGIWTQGRHTRGKGFLADMEKYNAAALLGFYVLRYTPDGLEQAVGDLRIMLAR